MNYLKNASSKVKKKPISIIYTGFSDLNTRVAHYRYTANSFKKLKTVENPSTEQQDMIVIEGFKNKEKIIKLAQKFNINDFYLEDIFNVSQRNKFETTKDQTFIVLKYAVIIEDSIQFRRIYFILKKGLIILFSDYENDYVKILLDRVKAKQAAFTSYDESYIVYTIYDMIIDEQIEMTRLYKLELEDTESNILDDDQGLSKSLFLLHKHFVQLRNNATSLIDNVSPKALMESEFFNENLIHFISDLDDHIRNLKEKLNTNIELCNTLISMYSTQISNKTNEVMKTLTIISVIFIPLSFLAGVFGMNFQHFGILNNEYGLLYFLFISLIISFGMLVLFRLRRWL